MDNEAIDFVLSTKCNGGMFFVYNSSMTIQPKKHIQNAIGYKTDLYKQDYKLKLDLNENLLGPSPKVIEAIKNVNFEDIKFYPVYGELIDKIAEFNNIDTSCVMPTCGADEAISFIFQTFIEAGDKVLTVNPSFAMPKVYATSTGCEFVEVDYEKKWKFPIESFLKEIDDNTKLIIITTPNSPTSEVIKEEDLNRIIEKGKNSLIMIDETYASWAEKSYADFANKYDNVLVTKSMSKDFAIAGLRLGYILSNSQNIEFIRRIISPFSVNIIAAKAAIASLSDTSYFAKVKAEVNKSKKLLKEGFEKLGAIVYPSDANFLCVDFGKDNREKAEFYYKKLINNGIKVKFYQDTPLMENTFRVAIPNIEGANLVLETLEPKKKLVIFDIDGVLINVGKSYRKATQETFKFFADSEITAEDIQEAKNKGGLNNDWDLTEFLLKENGVEVSKNEIIDKFQEFYFGSGGSGFIKNEELLVSKEQLEELSKEYDLAVFTGRPKAEALYSLKLFGIENLFNPIIAMEDVSEQKPSPEGIEKIKKQTGVEDICYLGDTPDDMLCAQRARVKGVGVLPPQDKSENLKGLMKEYKPMVILDTAKEFKGI